MIEKLIVISRVLVAIVLPIEHIQAGQYMTESLIRRWLPLV